MANTRSPANSPAPRINLWRLGRNMVLALVLPVCLAIVFDFVFGLWPFVTLVVAGLAFPIAGIVVIRSTMQELQKIIQELAPEPSELDESAATSSGNATSITEV